MSIRFDASSSGHILHTTYIKRSPRAFVAQKKEANQNKKKHLRLLPATEPLDSVAKDILGPLPRIADGNQYNAVITNRFSKLTRAIPTSAISWTLLANVFFENWIISFRIPSYLLTINGPQFVTTFFPSIRSYLGITHSTFTVYNPQTNGQA